jgi:multidrug resistance efflux pump
MQIRFHRKARSSPESIEGLKVPYAPAKRVAPKWRWYLIMSVLLLPVGWLVLKAIGSLFILSANGTVFLDQFEVRAPGNGRIVKVAAAVGARVTDQQVLMELEDQELEGALIRARAELIALQRSEILQRRQTSPAPTPVIENESSLREELALAERVLRFNEARRAATQSLLRDGAATMAELREAEAGVNQATAAVLQVKRQLEKKTIFTRPAETQPLMSAAAQRILDDIAQLEAKREKLQVRAGQAGRVLDVFATSGEFVSAGTPLMLVGRTVNPQVVAYVPPEIATRLAVGARATIRFPDGFRAQALVAETPLVTRRMPADLVNQFGVRPMTVVLHLESRSVWPKNRRIHGLPVSIRFHYRWEPDILLNAA